MLEASTQERPEAPRGLVKFGVIVGVLALIVVASGLVLRSRDTDHAQSAATAQSVQTVRLITPTGAGAASPLMLPGTLAAWTDAHIFARVPGYVHAWYHDIGAKVGEGAPLGLIDTPELDQEIIQARAALGKAHAEASLARTTAARWNDLLTTHSVSQQEADEKNGNAATQTAAVNEAQAALGRLQALKAYATVRAPFAGIVTARNADIGDLVGPGATNQQPLFNMADEHRIRVYVSVPQQYSAAIKPNLVANVTVPEYPGRIFPAKVVTSSGSIDQRSGTLQVELDIDNANGALRSGGYAQVGFQLPGSGATVVPATALVLRGTGTKVAIVDGTGHVHLLPVQIGRDLGSTVEIVAGLSPTMRIIDNPPDSLSEGEAVRVAGSHG